MYNWKTKYPQRFDLDTDQDYLKWRDEKLAAYPKSVGDLVVELGDMTAITAAEKGKIMQLVERQYVCLYSRFGRVEHGLSTQTGRAAGHLANRQVYPPFQLG